MEVLSVQSEARSPERGQYGFMQDLVRTVAYETLSRRDRKTLHLAAAEWLRGELELGGRRDRRGAGVTLPRGIPARPG